MKRTKITAVSIALAATLTFTGCAKIPGMIFGDDTKPEEEQEEETSEETEKPEVTAEETTEEITEETAGETTEETEVSFSDPQLAEQADICTEQGMIVVPIGSSEMEGFVEGYIEGFSAMEPPVDLSLPEDTSDPDLDFDLGNTRVLNCIRFDSYENAVNFLHIQFPEDSDMPVEITETSDGLTYSAELDSMGIVMSVSGSIDSTGFFTEETVMSFNMEDFEGFSFDGFDMDEFDIDLDGLLSELGQA